MPDTFIKIASVTVGSGGASSIDFTSIPSTYTDLCLKVSVRTAFAGFQNTKIRFNGSATSYSVIRLVGNGSTAASSNYSNSGTELYSGISSFSTSTFSNFDHYIPNYAGSNNKSISVDAVSEANQTEAYAMLNAGLWADTAAITLISYTNVDGSNFTQYSTATLYGIKNS